MQTDIDTVLRALSCDAIAETKARFLAGADFYIEVTTEMLSDPGFEALGTELEAENAAAAFETAHTLKGIISNCGVTPLCLLIRQITETLRPRNSGAVCPDYTLLRAAYAKLLCERETARGILSSPPFGQEAAK